MWPGWLWVRVPSVTQGWAGRSPHFESDDYEPTGQGPTSLAGSLTVEHRASHFKVRAAELHEQLQGRKIYGQRIDWDNLDCVLVAAYESGYSDGIS